MTSPFQLEANRRNGRLSHGPVTEAGMAISSQNSTTHGLFRQSSGMVEAGPFAEDADYVADVHATIERGLRPRDDMERLLATRIAELYLDLDRANAYKTVSLAAPATRRGSRRVTSEAAEEPTSVDAENVMARLEYALRLTGKVFHQLKIAMSQYLTLQERPLEIGYTGDLDMEDDINPIVSARAQQALWGCRVEYLEADQRRAEQAEEVAEFRRHLGLPHEPNSEPASSDQSDHRTGTQDSHTEDSNAPSPGADDDDSDGPVHDADDAVTLEQDNIRAEVRHDRDSDHQEQVDTVPPATTQAARVEADRGPNVGAGGAAPTGDLGQPQPEVSASQLSFTDHP